MKWAIEGRRLIPLMPRAVPQVAYTALATKAAQMYYGINQKLPPPSATSKYGKFDGKGKFLLYFIYNNFQKILNCFLGITCPFK